MCIRRLRSEVFRIWIFSVVSDSPQSLSTLVWWLPLESVHGHPSHFPEGLVFLSLSILFFLPGIDLDLLKKFSAHFLWLTPESFFLQTFKSWDRRLCYFLDGSEKTFCHTRSLQVGELPPVCPRTSSTVPDVAGLVVKCPLILWVIPFDGGDFRRTSYSHLFFF